MPVLDAELMANHAVRTFREKSNVVRLKGDAVLFTAIEHGDTCVFMRPANPVGTQFFGCTDWQPGCKAHPFAATESFSVRNRSQQIATVPNSAPSDRSHPMRHAMPLPRYALTCLVAASLLLGGCASQTLTRTGFLSGYDAMVPASGESNFRSYVKPGMLPGQYTHYLLDPVIFEPNSVVTLTEVEKAQLKTDLESAVRQSFEAKFQLAKNAGPGVLRLRFAITGVDKSSPGLNVAMAILIVPLANGGASTEAEALDSITGERLAALLASTNGSLVKGEFAGFFSEFGHAKLHFSKQANALRDRLSLLPAAAASAPSRQ
jgi:hypothetical protein